MTNHDQSSSDLTNGAARPRDGSEGALLHDFRALTPRQRQAFIAYAERLGDGQPAEAAAAEMFLELGFSPAQARRRAREALAAPDCHYRRKLV